MAEIVQNSREKCIIVHICAKCEKMFVQKSMIVLEEPGSNGAETIRDIAANDSHKLPPVICWSMISDDDQQNKNQSFW